MDTAIAAAAIGMLLLGAVILLVRRWRAGAAEKVSFAAAGPLLSVKERHFLEAAREALAPEFEVFAKVSLADVVRPSPTSSALLREKALQRLRKEHVDFVICRPDNGRILGVIDLDSSGAEHHEDCAFFDAALDAAGIPILRLEAKTQYDALILRQQAVSTFRPPGVVPASSQSAGPSAKVRTMVRRGTVWLRVEGNGTFQNSADVRVYTEQMFDAGHRTFAFDLHECAMMDSTFLGTLTGLALRLREDPRGRVGFARVSAKVESLFGRYGLDRVLAFQGFEAAPPAPDEMEELDLSTTREFKRSTLLEAHEALAESSPENEERFREVVDFLKRKEPE